MAIVPYVLCYFICYSFQKGCADMTNFSVRLIREILFHYEHGAECTYEV